MLNCDRCGLHKEGQSSIREYPDRKENIKKDYETLEFSLHSKNKYKICPGYESRFDSVCIYINGEYENVAKLKEQFSWIQNIITPNICDDCIFDMIQLKEARIQDVNDSFPFYTACCDKFVPNMDNIQDYFNVFKINNFPYLSYYKLENCKDIWDKWGEDIDVKYLPDDEKFFDYYGCCNICISCLKNKNLFSADPRITKDHPSFYTLFNLRREAEMYLPMSLKNKEILYKNAVKAEFSAQRYNHLYDMYFSKKNNLLLKKDLSIYLMSRNLSIIRQYIFISKDVFEYILKK